MNRRDFLKGLLTTGVAAYTLDIDKLLWVKGEKTIFLPTPGEVKVFSKNYISMADIVAAEMQRIMGILPTLFERDNAFYSVLKGGELIDTEINKRDPNHPIIKA